MRKNLILFALLLGLTGAGHLRHQAGLLIPISPTPQQTVSGITDPHENLAQLQQLLAQAEPNSPAAKKLLGDIKKLRRKALDHSRPAENPGALWAALAELKTAPDGTTYEPNYRTRELNAAIARKTKRAEQLPWQERGPGNISGRARAIVVDPGDPNRNTWFVASIGGGIWKTSDAGRSWEFKTPDMTALSTTCLAMAASDPNVMYAGTGMGYGRVVELAGSGIWKTTDRGETWFQLESTADGQLLEAINRIVVDPNDPDTLVVCSNDSFSHQGTKGGTRKSGIFRSTDGGQTWTQTYDPDAALGTGTDNRIQQIVADPSNFNRLYAAVNEVGVIRSFNGGLSWQVSANNFALPSDIGNPTGNGFGLAGISVRIELAVAPTNPNRIYAAVERPRGIADLYMTTNGGTSWRLMPDTGNDPNWFNNSGASGATGAYTAGWFDNTIAVHPFNERIVFVGGVNIYRIDVSADDQTRRATPVTWWVANNAGISQVHADHHWLEMIPVDQASNRFRIINANDGGVAVSNDGGQTWTARPGMITTQFYAVDKKPGEDVYIGGLQDNRTFHSPLNPDAASQWIPDLAGDGFEVVWHAENPNLLMGTSQNGNYSRSTDGAQSWRSIPAANAGFSPFISKIGTSKADPDLVFTLGSNGINRSDDFGVSWSLTPISGNWLGWRAFDNVEVAIADPRVVWISSRMDVDPASGVRGGIHVSNDGGLSFQEISQNFPPGVRESSGIGTHPFDADTAYMLFSAPGQAKILRTTDQGQTWQDLSGFQNGVSVNGFPDVAVFSLIVMPHNTEILWAGTEIGLFASEDGGGSWSYADNGLPHVAIFQMSVVENEVLVATQGRGIWTVELPELADYGPPQVTLTPRIADLTLLPTGELSFNADLRSAYDQSTITLDGVPLETLPANNQADSRGFLVPVNRNGVATVSITAQKHGEVYQAGTKQTVVFPVERVPAYSTDFSDNGVDFQNSGFTIGTQTGFTTNAAHSPHPYANNTVYSLMLKKAIRVPETNALMRYEDVALVEPGTGSGVFGDPQFWDYVVVEGTVDGLNWLPLAPGYDARYNNAWLTAYNNGAPADAGMFVSHQIDLLQTFQPGDVIFIRFSLVADPAVTGWGWTVRNIDILPDHAATEVALHRLIYPWLSKNADFQSVLFANNTGATAARVSLTARRENGEAVRVDNILIPANGFLKRTTAQLLGKLGDGAGFSVVLESESPHIRGGWVTNNRNAGTGLSPSQGVAVQVPESGGNGDGRIGRELLFGFQPLTDGFTSAPVVVNAGDTPTNVTLHFYNRAGELLKTDSETLAGLEPGRPFARVANGLLEGVNEDVTMLARSDSQPITGVVFVFNQQGESAIGNVSAVDNTTSGDGLLYPWVSNNDEFDSILIANNLGESEAQVTLTARRASGEPESVERTIPPNGFLREAAASLFPGLGAGGGYAVKLDTQAPAIHGRWVTRNLLAASGGSPSQGVAVDVPLPNGPGNIRVGGQVMFGFLPVTDGLISAPVVVNLNDTPTDVTLYFYDEDGFLLARDTESLRGLEPLRPFAAVANTLLGDQARDAYMVARADQGTISGVAFVFNSGREPAIGNVTNVPDYQPPASKWVDRRMVPTHDTVFPDPHNSPHVLPYPAGHTYRLLRGFRTLAADFSYRFVMPLDTPVIATRAGEVVRAWDHYVDGEHGEGQANEIHLRHQDGSISRYSGLRCNSLAVTVGQQVSQGMVLARSGDGGAMEGPAGLVFSVQAEPEGACLPISFRNAYGPIDPNGGFLPGKVYWALPH